MELVCAKMVPRYGTRMSGSQSSSVRSLTPIWDKILTRLFEREKNIDAVANFS